MSYWFGWLVVFQIFQWLLCCWVQILTHFLPDPTTSSRQYLSSQTDYSYKWGSIIKRKEHALQRSTIQCISFPNNSRMVFKIFQTFCADFILWSWSLRLCCNTMSKILQKFGGRLLRRESILNFNGFAVGQVSDREPVKI